MIGRAGELSDAGRRRLGWGATRLRRSGGVDRTALARLWPSRPSGQVAVLVIVALLQCGVVNSLVGQAYRVTTPALRGTLEVGDHLVVDKLSTRFGLPARGEPVLVADPGGWLAAPVARPWPVMLLRAPLAWTGIIPMRDSETFVLRVAAVPGDVVSSDGATGIAVNGKRVVEAFRGASAVRSGIPFSFVVPPRRVWLTADDPTVSWDSRDHLGDGWNGTVPADSVIGVAAMVVWPPTRISVP